MPEHSVRTINNDVPISVHRNSRTQVPRLKIVNLHIAKRSIMFPVFLITFLLLFSQNWAWAFPSLSGIQRFRATQNYISSSSSSSSSSSLHSSSTDVATNAVEALRSYMVKASEEKVKAIATTEAKYKAEIDNLKAQLATSVTSPTSRPTTPTTVEALELKVEAYESFVKKYIVDAQLSKLRAVQDAEQAIIRKFEGISASLLLSGSAPTSATPLPPSTSTSTSTSTFTISTSNINDLYEVRGLSILEAGASSRWTSEEVSKVSK